MQAKLATTVHFAVSLSILAKAKTSSLSKRIVNAKIVDNRGFKIFTENILRNYDTINDALVTQYPLEDKLQTSLIYCKV